MATIFRRLVETAVVLVVVSLLAFVLLEAAPGDFFDDLRLNPRVDPETIARLRVQYGLDGPLAVRYVRWLSSASHGDFGFSLAHHTDVASLLWPRAQNTLLLTVPAALLAWLLAAPLGVWCAVRRGGAVDRACMVATAALLSVPELLVTLVLIAVALQTGWLPTGGMRSPRQSDLDAAARVRDFLAHAAVPVGVLAAGILPVVLHHVRAGLVGVSDAPALQAARAHGIRPGRLLWAYALPMAANPLISLAGLSVATLLSASLLVEVVVGWPGLGPLLLDAVLARDLYVVVAASMMATVFLLGGNLLADVALAAVDRRIRHGEAVA